MKKTGIILVVLLGAGACTGPRGTQSVFDTAKKGDIAALKAILQTDPGSAVARGEGARSPLQAALLRIGRIDCLQLSLRYVPGRERRYNSVQQGYIISLPHALGY